MREVVEALLRALCARDKFLRVDAEKGLAKLFTLEGEESETLPLYPSLTDPSPSVRERAALVLAGIEYKHTLAALLRLFMHKDPDVRVRAVRLAGLIGDPAAAPEIKRRLGDRSREVRRAALGALLSMREPAGVQARIRALDRDFDGCRKWAVQFFGNLGPVVPDAHRWVPVFFGLTHTDERVRRQAIITWSRLGGEEAVKGLAALLRHKNGWVRMYAAQALGRIGHPASVPSLVQATTDRFPYARDSAIVALRHHLTDVSAVDATVEVYRKGDEETKKAALDGLRYMSVYGVAEVASRARSALEEFTAMRD